MSKRDDFKIDIMSSIDDDIIEKHTKKRFMLMNGKNSGGGKKTLVAIIAFAACFALFASVLVMLLPIIPSGQIPVYQGMTVSNEAPAVTVQTYHPPISVLSMTSKKPPEPDKPGKPTPPSPDNIPVVEGSDRALYYARSMEDIYITVHITNPDQFEILSFTLNGVKYQSYMFEPGSDSETLILKVNVGDAEDFAEYTIDAIKYVDGTEIKDVIMNGEKTVKVAIYPEEQPTAEISDIVCNPFDASLTVNVTDPLSLIKDSEGSVSALLYDGEEIIRKQSLSVGEATHLVYDDLDMGKSYVLRIVAYYDAIDGEGFSAHILQEITVETKKFVDIVNVRWSYGDLLFEVAVLDEYGVSVEKTELILDGGIVISVGDGLIHELRGLNCGVEKIIVSYSYDAEGDRVDAVFETEQAIEFDNSTGRILDRVLSNGEVKKEHYGGSVQIWNETTGNYEYHYGVDYAPLDDDDRVYAAAAGIVTDVYEDEKYGTTVVVALFYSSYYQSIYYQCLSEVTVEKGDVVFSGDAIAKVGISAQMEWKDGPHVHVAMKVTNEDFYLDPEDFMYPEGYKRYK